MSKSENCDFSQKLSTTDKMFRIADSMRKYVSTLESKSHIFNKIFSNQVKYDLSYNSIISSSNIKHVVDRFILLGVEFESKGITCD